MPNKIPLVVSNEVLDKIKYLCKNIPQVEWSGPLFYTFEGDITKPETFKIHAKDILPLDKGTAAFTSYQIDDRFIDFMEENPERMDWNMGHCHSHNVMSVFFSGVDTQELQDNADTHNFYVSLIVNNYMDMVARVAFIGKANTSIDEVPYMALDGDGKPYVIQTAKFNVVKEKLYYFECEVISEKEVINVDEKFSARVAEIMKPKPVKTPVYTATPHNNQKPKQLPAYQQKAFPKQGKNQKNKKGFNDFSRNFAEEFDFTGIIVPDEELDEDDFFMSEALDFFGAALFKFIGEPASDETLISVLEEWSMVDNIDEFDVANNIISRYSETFAIHFPTADDQDFSRNTYEFIDMLYDEEGTFPFIKPTIQAILAMVKKFESVQK